jgi:hydrogenase large subunit
VQDPEIVVTLVAHYLQALRMQMLAKRMGALFGGRAPHYRSIVVGGVTKLPTAEEVAQFRDMLGQLTAFVNDVYLADVAALASGPLLPLAKSALGVGHGNFLAYGAFDSCEQGEPLFGGGVIRSLDPANIVTEGLVECLITESVKHAWYEQTGALHPSVGETRVDLAAPGAYSFCKAPRYQQDAFEVGPLARMLIRKEPRLMCLLEQGVQPGTVARHAARAFETTILCNAMTGWLDTLQQAMGEPCFRIHDGDHWEPPQSGHGVGLYDAPRGALGHWVELECGKTKRYQMVVPTTWNASPRDDNGVRGPYEQALLGCPVPDEANPINVVRTIRSFDPCLGCAVHVIHRDSDRLHRFVVDPMMGAWV